MYQTYTENEPILKPTNYSSHETGRVDTLRAEPSPSRCNDALFALIFLVNVGAIAFFAFWKGVGSLDHNDVLTPKRDVDETFYIALLGLAGVGLVTSSLWLSVLLKFAEQLIRISLWANVGMLIAFAVLSMVVNPMISLFCVAMALFTICYIRAVEDRIAFASVNLKCACSAIIKHKSLVAVALLLLVAQLCWIALWALGALGVYQLFREADPNCVELEKHGKPCGGTGLGFSLFFLLVSFYWGAQVVKNILTCTTAGAVAAWWYQERPIKPVSGAIYRSLTSSFGSICFGSLIVAVLQALQTVARYLREKAQEDNNVALCCVACLCECILNCLAGIMQYINKWAYCYVGIYGYDFRTSGKAVMDLFNSRGLTAIINDDLTGTALGIGCIGVGFFTCGIGLLIAYLVPFSTSTLFHDDATRFGTFGVLSFVIGLSMAFVLASLITSALNTIFICFAEDPIAFSNTQPTLYVELVAAWRAMHPDVLTMGYHGQV